MPSNQDTPNESPHENVRAFASLDAFKSSRVTVIPYGSSEPTIPRVELELLGTDTNALGTARPSKPAFFPGLEPIIPPNGLKLLTPEIVAVLKYQREKIGPSIVTEPPSPGPPRPIRKKGREDELIYQRCNTCETFCGEYTYCDHESDDGEYDTTVNTNRIGERLKPVSIDSDTWEPPTSIGELEYEMLHPGNLSKLLTINTDQHVDQYVAFTTHGTLLGYSDSLIIKKARKIASLSGMTWRSNNLSVTDGDPAPAGTLPILSTKVNESGTLTNMTVKMDDAFVSIHLVKESIVIAAVLLLDASKGRSAESLSNPTAAKTQSDEPTAPNPALEPTSAALTHDQDPPSADPKGKAKEDDPQPPTPLPMSRQLKILSWRTEAMARVLRDDLADFKMPEGVF